MKPGSRYRFTYKQEFNSKVNGSLIKEFDGQEVVIDRGPYKLGDCQVFVVVAVDFKNSRGKREFLAVLEELSVEVPM